MNDDWDPKPHERQWYRHSITGDRGFLVRKDGKDFIRSDNPGEVNDKIFRPSDWMADHQERPLTAFHVAQICFEADKKYRFYMGSPKAMKENWLDLSEEKRILWMQRGPLATRRADLYRAIREALEPDCK